MLSAGSPDRRPRVGRKSVTHNDEPTRGSFQWAFRPTNTPDLDTLVMVAPVGSAFLIELIGTTGPINNRSRLRHGHDNPMSAGFKALKGPQIVLVLVLENAVPPIALRFS